MRLVLKTGASLRMQFFIRRDPLARDVVDAALVEERNDLLFEHVVEGLAFDVVLIVRIGVVLAAADGPADIGRVSFDPPAVEDRSS